MKTFSWNVTSKGTTRSSTVTHYGEVVHLKFTLFHSGTDLPTGQRRAVQLFSSVTVLLPAIPEEVMFHRETRSNTFTWT